MRQKNSSSWLPLIFHFGVPVYTETREEQLKKNTILMTKTKEGKYGEMLYFKSHKLLNCRRPFKREVGNTCEGEYIAKVSPKCRQLTEIQN